MKAFLLCGVTWCAATLCSAAADWHVATNGTPQDQGSRTSPWDIQSALDNAAKKVRPGDVIWISGGTYRHPDRKGGTMGYSVRLVGTAERAVIIRPVAGERVTIDGGLSVQPPSTFLHIQDIEILVSENLTQSRRFEETGSHPASYNRPWGGLNIYSGEGCKFINLIIHDNAQGVSWWVASRNSELYGCVIYNNGWDAPDRGHGHAIYTQNKEGVKTISDCIMTGGHGQTMHAYGSSRADVNNYLVTGNICYNGGRFLIGGGKPSHGIRVLTNHVHGLSMQLGYNAPHNEDCAVLGNVVVNGSLDINKFREVVKDGNRVLEKGAPRSRGTEQITRLNRYDSNRAHVAVFNWEQRATVQFSPGDFLKQGERFAVFSPTNLFGAPIAAGHYNGKEITAPVAGEFAAFVIVKH